MPRLPFPSKGKEIPKEDLEKVEVPASSKLRQDQPEQTKPIENTPEETPKVETTPEESPKVETVPDESPIKEEMPSVYNEENCVVIDGEKIEIKPTKLKYFRNKAASGYSVIKLVPLQELLTYGKGVVDEKRDADQLLFDFLVAVFDNSTFVRDHYENIDADVIDRIIKIFGRINHIDEREEAARKNREAQAKR